MEVRSLLACALALVCSSSLPAQQPAPASPLEPPHRLVYELPIDAMQRDLRGKSDRTLEQILAEAIDVARARAGDGFDVQRSSPTGFTVTVPHARAAAIPRLRQAIELQGTLEMRMVAEQGGDAALDLAGERARLQQWLDAGGRERVLADARALDAFHADRRHGPLAPTKLRWAVHRIRVDAAEPERWDLALDTLQPLQAACVPLYSKGDYGDRRVPAAWRERPNPELVELVALDLHQRGFANADIDPEKITTGAVQPRHTLTYALRPAVAADYASWTEHNIGHACAILWNGEVVTTPVIRSKIAGIGMIAGTFTRDEVENMARMLRTGPLTIAPKFLRQE